MVKVFEKSERCKIGGEVTASLSLRKAAVAASVQWKEFFLRRAVREAVMMP
jgi:hypothetical protein